MSHNSLPTTKNAHRSDENVAPGGSLAYFARHPDICFQPVFYYASVLVVAVPAMHKKLQEASKHLMRKVHKHKGLHPANQTQVLKVIACAQICLGALCTEIDTWYEGLPKSKEQFLHEGCETYLQNVRRRLTTFQLGRRPSTASPAVTQVHSSTATGVVQASKDQVTTLLEEAQLLVDGYTRVADLVKHALENISEPIYSWRKSTGALKDIFDQNLLEAVVAEFEPEKRGQWSSYKYRARAVLTEFRNQNSLASKRCVPQKQEELVRWIEWMRSSLSLLQKSSIAAPK